MLYGLICIELFVVKFKIKVVFFREGKVNVWLFGFNFKNKVVVLRKEKEYYDRGLSKF